MIKNYFLKTVIRIRTVLSDSVGLLVINWMMANREYY